MQKILILTIFVFAGFHFVKSQAKEQNRARVMKPFKLNLSLGFNTSHGFGLGPVIEPIYQVKDLKLSAGLRYMEIVGSRNSSQSYIAMADYYFYKFDGDYPIVASFIGIGTGLYSMADSTQKINNIYTSIIRSNQYGMMIRAGMVNEAVHLRLSFEYNFVTSTNGKIYNGFFCIVWGYFIGGGCYKKTSALLLVSYSSESPRFFIFVEDN